MTVQCGLVAESIRLRHNSFGLRITSTHWSSGNPNDFEGNEDCIDIFVTADECNDRSCDYYTPFICEFFLQWCTYTEDIQEHCACSPVFKHGSFMTLEKNCELNI